MNDYRYTIYDFKTENKKNRKKDLEKMILSEHCRATNLYDLVRDNGKKYKSMLLKIYDKKCVYCGNSLENIPITLFEIDHFINYVSFNGNDIEANKFDNLYPSCHKCNRSKHAFTIPINHQNILNPDENIAKVFERNDLYGIVIKKEFINDKVVCDFYDALSLDNETRRLDYLLLSMRGILKQNINDDVRQKLLDCVVALQLKRNTYS